MGTLSQNMSQSLCAAYVLPSSFEWLELNHKTWGPKETEISGLAFDELMDSPENYRWKSVTVASVVGVWKGNVFFSCV